MDENEIEQQLLKTKKCTCIHRNCRRNIWIQESPRKQWMTKETLEKIEERKDIKIKLLIYKKRSETEELQREYTYKEQEVKRSTRTGRRKWTN